MKRVVLFWLVLMSFSMASVAKSRVYLLGDGTMGIASDSVLIGWGDALNEYLTVCLITKFYISSYLKRFWNRGRSICSAKTPGETFSSKRFPPQNYI